MDELGVTEAWFRAFADHVSDAFYLHDDRGTILDVNQQACESLGYSREELIGMKPDQFDAEIAPHFDDEFLAQLKAGKDVRFDTYHRRRDGSTFPVEVSIRPYLKGKRTLIVALVRDISERKHTESALRESEERYRAIFQNSLLGIFRSTVEGRFLELNPAMAKMLGYDLPEQALREITDIGKQIYVHAEDRRKIVASHLREAGDTGQHFCHYRRRDGSEWFANLYLKTVRNAEGKPVFFDGIVEDITGRVKAEREREKLQEQLLHAQKMESVGRLAGGIAHDFNNILSVIIGYTELAMRDKEDSRRHAHLEQVRKAAQRSVNLTRQLLGFARKQIVLPKVLDLNETVESLLTLLQRMIGEDITLVWQPGEGLGLVNIDPSQFDQVLTNLAVNARDAIEGEGTIRIETRNADLDTAYCDEHPWAVPGSYVLVTFSDTGHGMDKEILAHAFEPFFTTKELGKGTGLGLATVYGIIKQNKGYIDIDSARGHGTTISIYLPRYAEEHVQGEKSDATAEGIAQGHETILIVEDEVGILQMAKLVLEQCGYRVLTASSAKQAMRQAEGDATGIQLLITDVVMPEMNGRQLANRILSLHPGMRCLFMSGYSGDTISRHGVLDEGVHFIQKPFSTSDLSAMVRRVLDGG